MFLNIEEIKYAALDYFLLIAVFLLFGLPVLPVLVGGGAAMSFLAFYLTRNRTILKLGLTLLMVASLHYLLYRLSQDMGGALSTIPGWVNTLLSVLNAEATLGFVAVNVICVSAFLGIFGPIVHLPADIDGVLRMVQEKKLQDKGQHGPND